MANMSDYKKGLLQELAKVWKGKLSNTNEYSIIERIAITPIILMRLLSGAQLKALFREGGGHNFMDIYVLSFAILITFTLWYPGHLGWVGLVIAIYRIADIITYRLYFLLVKSRVQPWTVEKLRRSVVIVVLNFYETIVGYAIVYYAFNCVTATSSSPHSIFTPVTYLYFSIVTATTLGYGDYVPEGSCGQIIAITQLLGTIVFLIFIIPALIALFSGNPGATPQYSNKADALK